MSQITNHEEISRVLRETWMMNTTAAGFWLLSPSSYNSYRTWIWYGLGNIDSANLDVIGGIGEATTNTHLSLRPCLNLKTGVVIISGDGSYSNPYKLLEG